MFDVNMDFTRKARWVIYRHETPDPIGPTYVEVVSRGGVRTAFAYTDLNVLGIFVEDIHNSYL